MSPLFLQSHHSPKHPTKLSPLIRPHCTLSVVRPLTPPPLPRTLTMLATPQRIVFGERQNFLFLHIPQLSFYTPDCKLQNYANNYKNCFTVRFTTPSRPVYISHGIWMDAFRTGMFQSKFSKRVSTSSYFSFFLFVLAAALVVLVLRRQKILQLAEA